MTANVWYMNAEYWAVAVSVFALVLSQLPPVITWWRPGELKIELDERFSISHFIGHPNCQAYLSVRNIGARPVRVTKLRFEVSHPDGALLTLRGMGYFQFVDSESPLALFPFSIEAGAEWAHLTNGVEALSETTEHRVNGIVTAMQSHTSRIQELSRLPGGTDGTSHLLTPPEIWQQAKDEFQNSFAWERGEYRVEVVVESDSKVWRSDPYRFTVYETAVTQLKSHIDAYISGNGLLPGRYLPGAQCSLKAI